MEVLKFPHPNLFIRCKPVTVFGPELVILLESMWEAMVRSGGLGLASNQVGLDYSMFTMEGSDKEKLFIVNPRILKRSPLAANLQEGCLSAPGDFVTLKRSRWVELEYQDEKGEKHTRIFEGIHAICVQHEMQHLIGQSHLQSKNVPKEIKQKWGLK
jgi:peptide deformylase